ncbi:MAG TPA: hypothetical protein VMN60_10910 [Longimicrobiales bacterium]|nr:hypothetical protein [Longimicrobiales bacterium]
MKLLSIAVAVPVAFAMVGVAATPTLPDDALKCGRSTGDPHYIVDGAFVDIGDDAGATLRKLDATTANIHSLAIICWDPVKRVLQRGTGENVVHVTTKTFVASLHEDLRRIVAAQDAFRAEHGRFAGKLTELELKPATPGIDITMSRSEAGWHATAAGDLLIITCHVFAGAVTPPVESLVEREPACTTLPQFTR